MAGSEDGNIIIEFVRIGSYIKVSAIDPATGTETSIIGDPAYGEAMLRRTALRKLRYVLRKQEAEKQAAATSRGKLA